MSIAILYYVHDPMCAWCYGFQQCLKTLSQDLPENVKLVKLLGGLAPDNNQPMPQQTREYIQQNWQRIEVTIPGVKFNYEFWNKCTPRRSTYPACRAVIAARKQAPITEEKTTEEKTAEDKMIEAIQSAYYQQARNPSDIETLSQLATEIGLSGEQFEQDIASEETNELLLSEIRQSRAMNADSFPSLVLEINGGFARLPIDYNNPHTMLEMIKSTVGRDLSRQWR
jgi:putative protein-disulfide isomerase